jgi:hypothetical protein
MLVHLMPRTGRSAHLEVAGPYLNASASEALARSEARIIPIDTQFDIEDHPAEWLGAIMDVGDWLRTLGLGQYEAAFRESEIDAEVLSELNDQHLKDLGVVLGHRLKILRALRELAATASSTAQVGPPSEPQPRVAAERRQLTVMFCDLVGSTALSARLDPEDMREIIGAFQHCCSGVITKFGGYVAKFMGDGVLAYFGYPQAHEDDAERAVRAGLALVQAAPRIPTN